MILWQMATDIYIYIYLDGSTGGLEDWRTGRGHVD